MGAQEELYWHVPISLSVCEFQSTAAKADKKASKESEAVPWVNIYSSWSHAQMCLCKRSINSALHCECVCPIMLSSASVPTKPQ